MDFSENLQKIRKSAGFSQERLAETLNVSRQTISKWETGEARPLTEHIFALARVLNCHLGDLLGEIPEEETALKPPTPPAAVASKAPHLRIWALGAMTAVTLIGLVVATNLCTSTSSNIATSSSVSAEIPFDFASQELLGYGFVEDTGTLYFKFRINDSSRVAIVYLCPDGSYHCDCPDDPDFLPTGEFHPAKS